MNNDMSDDPPDLAIISEAQQLATIAIMLLEHPRMVASQGKSGLYVTALEQAHRILYLVEESEACKDAEEFDAILYLISSIGKSLDETLSLLRIS